MVKPFSHGLHPIPTTFKISLKQTLARSRPIKMFFLQNPNTLAKKEGYNKFEGGK